MGRTKNMRGISDYIYVYEAPCMWHLPTYIGQKELPLSSNYTRVAQTHILITAAQRRWAQRRGLR